MQMKQNIIEQEDQADPPTGKKRTVPPQIAFEAPVNADISLSQVWWRQQGAGMAHHEYSPLDD
jgi:hypothetical protein